MRWSGIGEWKLRINEKIATDHVKTGLAMAMPVGHWVITKANAPEGYFAWKMIGGAIRYAR